jgi:hypothetical protein
MPWDPDTNTFYDLDQQTTRRNQRDDWYTPLAADEFAIDDEPDPAIVPVDVAMLGLCLLTIVVTCAFWLPWTRAPLGVVAGIVLILAGCGVLRTMLERRRPDSGLVDWLRRTGL